MAASEAFRAFDLCDARPVPGSRQVAIQNDSVTHMVWIEGQQPAFYAIEPGTVTRKMVNNFWTTICTQAASFDPTVAHYSIAEIIGIDSPVVVDLELIYDPLDDSAIELLEMQLSEGSPNLHLLYLNFVNCVERSLFENLNITSPTAKVWNSMLFTSGILSSATGLYSIRLRLQFPYMRLETDVIEKWVIPRVIEIARGTNMMSAIGALPVNNLETAITTPSGVLSFLGLGSVFRRDFEGEMSPGSDLAIVAAFFDTPDIVTCDFTNGWSNRHDQVQLNLERVVKAFPLSNHPHAQYIELNNDFPRWIPLILSQSYAPDEPLISRRSEHAIMRSTLRGSVFGSSGQSVREDKSVASFGGRSARGGSVASRRGNTDMQSVARFSSISSSVSAISSVSNFTSVSARSRNTPFSSPNARGSVVSSTKSSKPSKADMQRSLREFKKKQKEEMAAEKLLAAQRKKNKGNDITASEEKEDGSLFQGLTSDLLRQHESKFGVSAMASTFSSVSRKNANKAIVHDDASSRASSSDSGYDSGNYQDEDRSIAFTKTGSVSTRTRDTMKTNYLRGTKRNYQIMLENPDAIFLPSDEDILNFVGMISKDRAKQASDLEDIASAIYTTTLGDKAGFRILRDFVKRAGVDGQTRSFTKALWSRQRDTLTPKTGRTLAFLAREDSFYAYDRWHVQWIDEALLLVEDTSHLETARVFYRMLWLDLICTGTGAGVWYKFANHVWELSEQRTIEQTYLNFVESVREMYYVKLTDMQNTKKGEYEDEKAWCAAFEKVSKKMGDLRYANSVISTAGRMFYDPMFGSLIDKNFKIKGIRNGVICCEDDRVLVRNGRPEDYVSKRMHASYDPSLSLNHPAVRFVLDFYHKLWCDEELELFMRTDFASYLQSGNPEKLFRQWIGPRGNNGKTVLTTMLMNLFGADSYAISITVSMYTGRDVSAEASMPQLSSMMGCALAFGRELAEDVQLRVDKVKEHTGNEMIAHRSHHQQMRSSLFSAKLIFQSNYASQFLGGGQAIEKRNLIVPFLSHFSQNAPDSIIEQEKQRHFKENTVLQEQLRKHHNAVLWLMVHDFARYRREGLVFPRIVKEEISKFWMRDNLYGMFMGEMVQKVTAYDENDREIPDPKSVVTYEEIFTAFCKWFEDAKLTTARPSKKAMFSQMERFLGTPIKSVKETLNCAWEGVKIERVQF
jgi:hypothetical protein